MPAADEGGEIVFEGEYESHHDATCLDILDIGANVGSFALWAELRWPGSKIRCYEPNPGTFAFLKRNTAGHPAITCHNAALFGAKPRGLFSRHDGDGEAGLASIRRPQREAVVTPAFESTWSIGPRCRRRYRQDRHRGRQATYRASFSATSLGARVQNRRSRLRMQEV
jgi:hypothetical protein